MWKSLTNECLPLLQLWETSYSSKRRRGLLFYDASKINGMGKVQLEEVTAFIREHRSNESNFEKLYAKLEEQTREDNKTYTSQLLEIKEKSAEEYRKAKETGGTAWPEFEKFVSEFEKTVIDALKETE
jgi:hypothetical protein